MKVAIGQQSLGELIAASPAKEYRRRYCYSDLANYLLQTKDPRVCTLYGLRRTGKTTLMLQAIEDIHDYDHTLFIRADRKSEIHDLEKLMDQYPDAKYVFVDEITEMDDFQDMSGTLADWYAARGRRIVLTGTDSLGIHFSLSSELFDRSYIIHTTYIPFCEYSELLGIHDIDTYLRYGGTLTDGKVMYNKGFADTLDYEYTNSAIADNIQHSLEHCNGGDGEFGPLLRFYATGTLKTFINKVVENDTKNFIARSLNRKFKSATLGAVKTIVGHQKEEFDFADPSLLTNPDLVKNVCEVLSIQDPVLQQASEEEVRVVRDYLVKLDVLLPIGEHEAIFSQPGIRYSQMEKILDEVKNDPMIRDRYTDVAQKKVWKRLQENVLGKLMENVVFIDLAKNPDIAKQYKVTNYRQPEGKYEFDIVLIDKKERLAYLMEVKHSKECVSESQAKHLLNPDACQKVEEKFGVRIAGKAVVYRGVSATVSDGISYLNVENFLCNPKLYLPVMRDAYQEAMNEHGRNDEWSR